MTKDVNNGSDRGGNSGGNSARDDHRSVRDSRSEHAEPNPSFIPRSQSRSATSSVNANVATDRAVEASGLPVPEIEHARLVEHVSSLENADRLILMLTYAESLTPHEVAKVLDLEEPHVIKRLNVLKESARRALHTHRDGFNAVRA